MQQQMSLQSAQQATTHQGMDKIKRYGWTMKDRPGILTMLHKDALLVDPTYQRELNDAKAKQIAAAWSWIACGAIIVGKRGNVHWVIDGQHRVFGAKRRSDVEYLPCLVFETEDVQQEAKGFLDVNTGRKPITTVGRHKAMVASGDSVASFVQAKIEELGLRISKGKQPNGIQCLGWCMKRASENRERFVRVITLVAEMSVKEGLCLSERVLEGVWHLDDKCGNGLADKRLSQRLKDKGAQAMLDAANRAAAFYASGGGKVWAEGMLAELNKGLRDKFLMESAKT